MGMTMLKFNLYHPVINLTLSCDGVIDELDLETNVVSDTVTRVLIETCFQLHADKQSVDLNTIKARVYAAYGQEGVDAITTVAMESLAQPANINALSDYVSQINDTNNKRTLQVELQKLLTQCSSNKMTDEIICSMHSVIESYDEVEKNNESGPISLKDAFVATLDNMERRNKGEFNVFKSGFACFEALGGFRPADFIILAGRPSHGKTTLLLNVIKNSSYQNEAPFLFFSIEMSSDSIGENLLSNLASIPLSNIRNASMSDTQWSDCSSALGRSSDYNIEIDDDSMTVEELCRRARRFYRQHNGKISGIGVDYIQLLTSEKYKTDNRNLEVSEISRQLKGLGKELGVPVIALSQLSRDIEKRADKRPVNSDLRESGSLEQDADIICFIYRPEMYDPQNEPGIAHLIISKARKAAIGSAKTTFIGKYAQIKDSFNYTQSAPPAATPIADQYQGTDHKKQNTETNDTLPNNNANGSGIEFIN